MKKICRKCNVEKDLELFGSCKTTKDKKRPDCKACVTAYNKAYRKKNANKLSAQGKVWREANKERKAAMDKAYWYEDETNKIKHQEQTSIATKEGIAEKDSTEARSKRAKEAWEQDGYRESREGLFAGENNPQYGKFGADHPAYGHRHTDETKEKIANALKGRIVSQETKEKLSQTRIRIMAPQKAETEKT